MSVQGSVRDRRRAETVGEIKAAALDQLATAGTGGISLRGVARAVGMTVQSLYHYFDSRDALLSALVTDSHHALADAAETAAAATRGRPPRDRRLATTGAFREWALANTSAFLLLYGTPVPGFDPGPASMGWNLKPRPGRPEGGEALGAAVPDGALPAGALALFIELRGRMHGLVMLELLGHLWPFQDVGEQFFTAAMGRMSDELDALQARPDIAGG